jgi:hypothetical protein
MNALKDTAKFGLRRIGDNARTYERPAAEQAARLREAFAPHNDRLFSLLGEDLGWSPTV